MFGLKTEELCSGLFSGIMDNRLQSFKDEKQ